MSVLFDKNSMELFSQYLPALSYNAVVSNSNEKGGTVVAVPPLTNEIYDQLKHIFEAAGGHWNEHYKGFYFVGSIVQTKQILTDLSFDKVKRYVDQNKFQIENQFYATPSDIARKMVSIADINSESFVLEPSAGNGRIVQEILPISRNLIAVEPNSENVSILTKLKNQYGSENESFHIIKKTFEEFCNYRLFTNQRKFDAIIMNPPFSEERDLRHIMLAYQLLAPYGTLVALAATNSLQYDRFITEYFNLFCSHVGCYIEQLPKNSFLQSGTSVDVSIIVLKKYHSGPIF